MSKVLVVYDSRKGNTEKMAKAIAEGVKESGVEVVLKRCGECTLEDLVKSDGIIMGSPTHFGTMSEGMKVLVDKSVQVRRKLENKVGAAFTSSGVFYGGNETTLFSLIQAMLIHGMIIVGDPMDATGHYGAIAVKEPDEKAREVCRKLGRRVGELTKRL